MDDKRIGKKPPNHFSREASSTKLDSGPFLGKVKNPLDPTRSGRLQVWIPELGAGDENNPENWRTVSYASPFFGSTYQPDTTKENAFSKVRHTYGFWAIPPDVGAFVLCTFVVGDPDRGYWFACVPNQLTHHMVPGIAGSDNIDVNTLQDTSISTDTKPMMASEFNENADPDWTNFVSLPKPIHEYQQKILQSQGLETDFVRGVISSSSQREMPSAVFGMSTPGRPLNDPDPSIDFKKKIEASDLNPSDYAVGARKGGHQFVMDDGNWKDKDRLLRLRSSGGHQILMSDSEKILYIGNSDGSVWIELTSPGHLNIYSAASINIRSGADLNFHADNNINFNAGKSFNMSAGKDATIQSQVVNINSAQNLTLYGGQVGIGSDGGLNINASGTATLNGSSGTKITGATVTLNEGGSVGITRPTALTINKLPDTGKDGKIWKSVDGALSTIVPIAPTHEPWKLHMATEPAGAVISTRSIASPLNAAARQEIHIAPGAGVVTGSPPNKDLPVTECKGGQPIGAGPKAASGKAVHNPVNKSYLKKSDAPSPQAPIGNLTLDQTKALFTQLAWNESGWRLGIVNQFNYLGKYQMGAIALATIGYIKLDAYKAQKNSSVNYPASWTQKAINEGVSSKEDFLKNAAFQEKAMWALTSLNYKSLLSLKALSSDDDQCTVAGMLAAAHLIGANGAANWRNTGVGQDANGTTGTTYFNMGRYAVDVLATTTA